MWAPAKWELLLLLVCCLLRPARAQQPQAAPGPLAAGPDYYSGDVSLKLVKLDTEAYPDAVCNGVSSHEP